MKADMLRNRCVTATALAAAWLCPSSAWAQANTSSASVRAIERYFQERQTPLWNHLAVPDGDRADYKRYDEALRKLRQPQLSDKAAADLLNRLLEMRGLSSGGLTGDKRQRALQALQTLSSQGLSGQAAQQALAALGSELGLSASEVGGALASLGGGGGAAGATINENLGGASDALSDMAFDGNSLNMAAINPPRPLSPDEEGLLDQPYDGSWAGKGPAGPGLPFSPLANGFGPPGGPGLSSSTQGNDPSTVDSSGRRLPMRPQQPEGPAGSPMSTMLHGLQNSKVLQPQQQAFYTVSGSPILHAPNNAPPPPAKAFDVRELLGGDFARQAQQERRALRGSSTAWAGLGATNRSLGQGLGADCPQLATTDSDQVCKTCPSSDACSCQKALDDAFAFKKDARALGKSLGKKIGTVRLELLKKPLKPIAVVGENLSAAQDQAVIIAAAQAQRDQTEKQNEALLESSALLNAAMGAQSPGCYLARDYAKGSALPASEWLPETGADGCQRFDSADVSKWKSPADRARVLMFVKTMDEFLFASKVSSVKTKDAEFAITEASLTAPPTHIPSLVENVLLNKGLYKSDKADSPSGFNYMAKNLTECHGDKSWGKTLEGIEAELRPLAMTCETVEAHYFNQLNSTDGTPSICSFSSSKYGEFYRQAQDGGLPETTESPESKIDPWIKESAPNSFRSDFAKLLSLNSNNKNSCIRITAHYQLLFNVLTNSNRMLSQCKKQPSSNSPRDTH
jgi:hypothetical protein